MTNEAKALVELQRAAGLKDLPTPLTHDLRIAVSGKGPRAYDWQDKPHRLLYDACAEIETQAREIERLRAALPDDIDLFRIIRRAGRSDREKAQAVYACIRAALAGDSHEQ